MLSTNFYQSFQAKINYHQRAIETAVLQLKPYHSILAENVKISDILDCGYIFEVHLEEVVDTEPPNLDLQVTSEILWPANHKYVDIVVSIEVSDEIDPSPTVELVSIISNELDDAKGSGDGNTIQDIVIIDLHNFKLRAERDGFGDGRVYTITYRATNVSGNSVEKCVTVFVPHDLKNNSK